MKQIKISNEIHKALKVYASERATTMRDIADRVLSYCLRNIEKIEDEIDREKVQDYSKEISTLR